MNSNYIEKIFGSERSKITLNDVKDFFSTPQEESSILEFKSGGVEIIDLYKEITAFLNTEGGLLIVGAPRETTIKIGKTDVKVCVGNLDYSKFKNKDWLYQKIAVNVVPTPVDIKIEEFITEDGNVFLIDIPQSMNPPHQCSSDGKYYLRLERDAKLAPHGIVQALFNKRRVPDLSADIKFKKVDYNYDDISIRVQNQSSIPAEKVSILVNIFDVESIECKQNFQHSKDDDLDCFTYSDSLHQILVQIVSMNLNIKVLHRRRPYAVYVAYWCRDLDIQYEYSFYNPETEEIFITGNRINESDFYEDLDTLKA